VVANKIEVVQKPDMSPDQAIELCKASHQRFLATAEKLTDETAKRPSLLPGWTVGYVLTHVARNADGHARRLEGALEGREVARYPGGPKQREDEIEKGATRPAAELKKDVAGSIERLEAVWDRSVAAGWPNSNLLAGDKFSTSGSPVRRLREVEVHHVDLNLGYTPADWPDEYLQWELPRALDGLAERIEQPDHAKRLLAWLIGRAKTPGDVTLRPWL
jgi:maleylpyruvate isomerase